MPVKVKTPKWILYRHTNNLDIIKAVAVNLIKFSKGNINKSEKILLNKRLKKLAWYKERNPELPLDAINHKINTLAYFMFGYKSTVNGDKKFMLSPLGDLMIENFENHEISSKIFLSQLFAVQFPHPHSSTSDDFKLYPYRLIFQLLNEPKLNYKLYSIEVALLIVFIKTIDKSKYQSLVNEILELRKSKTEKIIEKLEKNNHAHVNSYYEWDYYQSKLFESAGLISRYSGECIHKMKQGTKTIRIIKNSYIVLNKEIKGFCVKLLNNYSLFKTPIELNQGTRLSKDIIKEIYSFFPEELMDLIGIKKDRSLKDVYNLMKSIDYHSENPEKKSPDQFEILLTKGLNLINIDAQRLGGSGKTDIECLFLDDKSKFCVDAKVSRKLNSLNSGRLRFHRKKVGAKYTIIITSRYVPSVLTDIDQQDIVIILANTFTEYLYKNIKDRNNETDYSDIHNLILSNPGSDISNQISDLTIKNYGV